MLVLHASISEENSTENYYGLYNEADKVRFYDGKIYGKNTLIKISKKDYTPIYLNYEKIELLENKYLHQGLEEINGIIYKTNYISTTPVVTLTVAEETTGYTSIHEAIDAVFDNEEATIKMEDNEELFKHINIPKERNITLDLNGKTITIYDKEYGIYTEADNLTIKDEVGEGLIDVYEYCNYNTDKEAYGIYNSGDGNINIFGGNINISFEKIWWYARC